MNLKRNYFVVIAGLQILLFSSFVFSKTTVGIVYNTKITFYKQIIDILKEEVNKQVDCSFVEIQQKGKKNKLISTIIDTMPDFLVCFGDDAAKAGSATDIPGIFALVSDPQKIGVIFKDGYPVDRLAGYYWQIAPDKLLTFIYKIDPLKTNLGIIYSNSSATFFKDFNEAAKDYSYNVISRKVKKSSEVLKAFNIMNRKRVDFLFGYADPIVYNRKNIANAISLAKKNLVSFIGFAPSMTAQGALVSFYVNEQTLGEQNAELLVSIINGTEASGIQTKWIEKFNFSVNLKAAKTLKMDIPEEILQDATEVIKN